MSEFLLILLYAIISWNIFNTTTFISARISCFPIIDSDYTFPKNIFELILNNIPYYLLRFYKSILGYKCMGF